MTAEHDQGRILTGALVRTFDANLTLAKSIGVRDGKVIAVGSADEVSRFLPDAERIELDGGSLMPGFCDTHMHLEKIATELAMVQLDGAGSVGEVTERVRINIRELEPGMWCRAFGDDNAWHERQLAEGRLPTRSELDRVSPENPVYLYRGPDMAVLNSRAAHELAGPLAAIDGWNEADGALLSPHARELEAELPAGAHKRVLLSRAAAKLIGFGITTIVDPGLPGAFESTWDLYTDAHQDGSLPIRTWLMDRLDHRVPYERELHRVLERELSPFEGDDYLHGFGLKLILDGEFDNAWMRSGEPQHAPPARRYRPDELRSTVNLCVERGWPLCIHVMGGGAFDAVADAVEAERNAGRALAPGQLTLAHAFQLSQANIATARRLGISISVQPLLAYVFENEMIAAWGELADRANPYRSILEGGVPLAGGSDVLPCEPLRGAAYAVTRRSREGTVLGPDQAVSAEQAIALFTSGAAGYLSRPGHGTLTPGAPADFAWWPDDPLLLPPEQWPSLRPRLVAIGNKTAWDPENLLCPPAEQ